MDILLSLQGEYSRFFVPGHILAFNAGDLIGRAITRIEYAQCFKPRVLVIASIGRIAFLVPFTLCNIACRGAIIPSDAFFFIVLILFGLSNGVSVCIASSLWNIDIDVQWITTCSFLAVPKKVFGSGVDEAMGMMSILLCFGLVLGSGISFAVSAILGVW